MKLRLLLAHKIGSISVVAVLGLSFKPQTDDIRNAPSLSIIKELAQEGALLRLYDPEAMEKMQGAVPEEPHQIRYVRTPYEAVEQAHALLIVTEWEEFSQLDLEKIRGLMSSPIILDGRNVFDPEKMQAMGFEYYSVGRK